MAPPLRKLNRGAWRDCPECDGTGIYSPGLDPQWDQNCGECRGEGVIARPNVLPFDAIVTLRGVRHCRRPLHDGKNLYQRTKERLFRKIKLP
jgi:hypothetical protein